MIRRCAAALPSLGIALMVTGCYGHMSSTTQTVELSLSDSGRPAAGIEVLLLIPSGSLACDGLPAHFEKGSETAVTDSNGQVTWERRVYTSDGRRRSNGPISANRLMLCQSLGNDWRELWRTADTRPHRRISLECDLARPSASPENNAGACVQREQHQTGTRLDTVNIGLLLLMWGRVIFARRNLTRGLVFGFAALFGLLLVSGPLQRIPVAGDIFNVLWMAGSVLWHIVKTVAPRQPAEIKS